MPVRLISPELALVVSAVSLLTFLLSLAAGPWIVIRMRADYFVRPAHADDSFARTHPIARWLGRTAKNLLGAALFLAGLAMLVLPGQGLLTLLAALALLEFPGKRRLERWLVRRSKVAGALNWIRRKAGRPPLELPRADAA